MIETYTLNNGIRVISDQQDFFSTFSLGFWINVGSIYEEKNTNGYTHLLEHMLFKGTVNRSYLDISQEIESVGGHINAFTNRENTCFYVNLMSHHIELGVNILWDMITNSIIDNDELDKEKMVVMQEINMGEDSPDELINDLFFAKIWKNQSAGYPILGSLSNIENADRKAILHFFQQYYATENLVISIAGNFNKKALLKQLEELTFTQGKKLTQEDDHSALIHFDKTHHVKPLEQVYFNLAFAAFSRHHAKRYVLYILNMLLGGGSSSRLFVEVREKLGLCYHIYSFQTLLKKNGILGVGASASPENYPIVVETVIKELDKLVNQGITEDELHRAKEQIKGSIIFSQENIESRMIRNAQNELFYQKNFSLDEILYEINQVSKNDVHKLISEIITGDTYSFFSLGPEKHDHLISLSDSLFVQN